jgi:hypothetical protein
MARMKEFGATVIALERRSPKYLQKFVGSEIEIMSGPIMGQRARTRAEARHRPTREDQYDRRGLSARHCPRRRGGVERAGGRID